MINNNPALCTKWILLGKIFLLLDCNENLPVVLLLLLFFLQVCPKEMLPHLAHPLSDEVAKVPAE